MALNFDNDIMLLIVVNAGAITEHEVEDILPQVKKRLLPEQNASTYMCGKPYIYTFYIWLVALIFFVRENGTVAERVKDR